MTSLDLLREYTLLIGLVSRTQTIRTRSEETQARQALSGRDFCYCSAQESKVYGQKVIFWVTIALVHG